MTINSVRSVVGLETAKSVACPVIGTQTTKPSTAAFDKGFLNVFKAGGLAVDPDGDWCPTKPHPGPHGPVGGPVLPQIR